jgi:hypothetical protein
VLPLALLTLVVVPVVPVVCVPVDPLLLAVVGLVPELLQAVAPSSARAEIRRNFMGSPSGAEGGRCAASLA